MTPLSGRARELYEASLRERGVPVHDMWDRLTPADRAPWEAQAARETGEPAVPLQPTTTDVYSTPPVPRESENDCTLDAVDDSTGGRMTFEDFVYNGDEVALYRRPEAEQGFLGLRIVHRVGGAWRLRKLTAEEGAARTARIVGGA